MEQSIVNPSSRSPHLKNQRLARKIGRYSLGADVGRMNPLTIRSFPGITYLKTMKFMDARLLWRVVLIPRLATIHANSITTPGETKHACQ